MMSTKKVGRPKEPPLRQFSIAMSESKFIYLEKMAIAKGLTVSEYCRFKVFGVPEVRDPTTIGFGAGLKGSEHLVTTFNSDGTKNHDPLYAPYPKTEEEIEKRASKELLMLVEKVEAWRKNLNDSRKNAR
jgi:hypothetical protein